MKKQQNIKSWLKPALGVSALLVLAMLILTAVGQRKSRAIRELAIAVAEVENEQASMDVASIRDLLKKSFGSNFVGKEVQEIDIARIEAVLEQDPFVRQAEVWIDARYVLHILLHPRIPILRIMDGKGQNYYLDADGNRMPKSPKFWARTLVATGDIPPYVPDFKERKRYVLKDLYLLALDILEDPYMRGLTEQIHVERGAFTLMPKIGKQRILLGRYKHVSDKFERLKRFYREVLPYRGLKYKTIDLRYKEQVVCKK